MVAKEDQRDKGRPLWEFLSLQPAFASAALSSPGRGPCLKWTLDSTALVAVTCFHPGDLAQTGVLMVRPQWHFLGPLSQASEKKGEQNVRVPAALALPAAPSLPSPR